MPKPFPRKKKLWFSYRNPVTQKWKNKRTGYSVGEEREAQQYVNEFMKALAVDGAADGPVTVSQFAERWLSARKTMSVNDDRARLELHVLPRIGRMPMVDVRPRHIDDVIQALKDEGKLAPRTIRQISGVMHTMFKRAYREELIPANPVEFERGMLPPIVDADPTWRHEAIYSRAEIERLISDERILPDRRVLYGLKALAALRHTEAATLRWSQYDTAAKPLGSINLGHTKSGFPRQMPVHPTLAKILAAWKLSGWEITYGRKPTHEDLIVPTRNATPREAAEAQEALLFDLDLLGLRVRAGKKRNRRGHDMRRTFITLARTDGAVKDILRWATHGPTSKDMMDVYSSFEWPTLCAEVSKLKIALRKGALETLAPYTATPPMQSARKRWKKVATPTGSAPIGTAPMRFKLLAVRPTKNAIAG